MAGVLIFARLMDEGRIPPDTDVNVTAISGVGSLSDVVFEIELANAAITGIGSISGQMQLEIPVAHVPGAAAIFGGFSLDIAAGAIVGDGNMDGQFELQVQGSLSGSGALYGQFEVGIDVSAIIGQASISDASTSFDLNPPSEDVKNILVSDPVLGLTLAFGVNVFIGPYPEQPDSLVSIYDSPGEKPEFNYSYERPHVQVVVRGARGGYRDAHILSRDIAGLLHGIHNEEHGGARYVGIWMIGDVNSVGEDQLQRPMFTINFRLHRTVVA